MGGWLTTALVLGATTVGLLVMNACTNVAGLTGYEFVDGSAEADAATDASTADSGHDAADTGADVDSGLCTAPDVPNGSADCQSCVQNDCCTTATDCLGSTLCMSYYAAGCPSIGTGTTAQMKAKQSCELLKTCAHKCGCNG